MQIAAGGPQGGKQSTVNLIPGLQALLAQQAPIAPGTLPGEPHYLSCFTFAHATDLSAKPLLDLASLTQHLVKVLSASLQNSWRQAERYKERSCNA